MSPSLVQVETEDFAAASVHLRAEVADQVAVATGRLVGVLQGSAAMAGSDPGGLAWAAAYDESARAALGASQDIANACLRLSEMLAQTARNYEAAEAASTAGARHAIAALARPEPPFGLPACVPSASGGSGAAPDGWGMVAHLVGYVWPNGHQDRLRATAAGWAASADVLRSRGDLVTFVAMSFALDGLPEIDDVLTVCQAMRSHLRALAEVHAALARGCVDLAGHIDDAHASVRGELASLLDWSAGIQGVGAAMSVLTLGTAEVPTQAAEVARIAAAAARIAAIIERFAALARTVAASVAAVVERAARVSAELRAVLGVRLVQASVAAAARMRAVRVTRELGALGRLADDAEPEVVLFTDRAAARAGLRGALRIASNRFFRGATSKCEGFKIAALPDGAHRLEFFAPANNAGYGKLYVQTVDSVGRVTTHYKDTIGPEGLIERKWIQGGPP